MQASKTKVPVTHQYIEKHVPAFLAGRYRVRPVLPKTIPDARIKDILNIAYSIPPNKLDEAILYHAESMGAENFLGWILESYMAFHAEKLDWVWCTGSLVRAIDFIKPLPGGGWRMLQIKNRSNSENSSSSKVRLGTTIEKWFRIYANTGKTNWNAFPDNELKTILSEEGFRDYIVSWLKRYIRQQSHV